MKWLPLFIIFLVCGCGNPRKVVPELKTRWCESELQSTIDLCAQGADKSNRPDLRVVRYCRCIYSAAATRWSYDEYKKNLVENESFLTKEVSPGCETRVLKGEE